VVLDGDEVRERLSKELGFSKKDRTENMRRVAYICRLINHCDGIVIAALISPYRSGRQDARLEIGNFIEVYVKCALEVCAKRDVKGQYAKARTGELQEFTGVSDPYEEPLVPEIVVETDIQTTEESLSHIVKELIRLELLVV
jgi:adenylyl-sulfate kinase